MRSFRYDQFLRFDKTRLWDRLYVNVDGKEKYYLFSPNMLPEKDRIEFVSTLESRAREARSSSINQGPGPSAAR